MRQTTIPQQTVSEDIISFEHNIEKSFVRVLVGKGTVIDGTFTPLPSQTYEHILICNFVKQVKLPTEKILIEEILDYTELMSANPSWAPTKPANVFRKDDLWHIIDIIRARG